MQSTIDTDAVLEVRLELEAIIEAAEDRTGKTVEQPHVVQTRTAILSLDDALRCDDPADAEAHIGDASTLIRDMQARLEGGPFDRYVQRAEKLLPET